MSKADTKIQILNIALDLFSKRGYSAVSIRDICGQVGIKESTLYYHFKNKQAVFESLCEAFTKTTYAIPVEFQVQMAKVTRVEESEFIKVCQAFLNDYLMEDKINKFICMLIIEQRTNWEAAELYHRVLFDDALEKQRTIFKWLIDIGFLKDEDLDEMVISYYAPVIFLFQRYLITEELTEALKAEVNKKLLQHIQGFLKIYKR